MSPDYYLANEDLHFLGQVWIATAGNSCKDQTSLLYRLSYILLWRSEGDIRYDDTCPSTVFYWVQKKMSRAHVPKILINDQALHLSFAVVLLVFNK